MTIILVQSKGVIELLNKLEQTTCKRCGRKLKSEGAIKIGMGATCWKKYLQDNSHKKLFDVAGKTKSEEGEQK